MQLQTIFLENAVVQRIGMCRLPLYFHIEQAGAVMEIIERLSGARLGVFKVITTPVTCSYPRRPRRSSRALIRGSQSGRQGASNQTKAAGCSSLAAVADNMCATSCLTLYFVSLHLLCFIFLCTHSVSLYVE